MKFQKSVCLVLILSTFACFFGCASVGKSLNVKIMETTRTTVRFRPVCPDCKTVGESRVVVMYAGEGDTFGDVVTCDECWNWFDVEIIRD